ncbi:two-component regulator propeller domain-containing protein [Opitutus sp. ER46]|uniref:ligand-binding sensor domain-containing protein n=1 Tax=Opitutus sp. ER46 TaxID=2161864 RepID=UPI001304DE5A|nr:two-component regulator propeller domain-containing protein [Opitutus sp. ER46]
MKTSIPRQISVICSFALTIGSQPRQAASDAKGREARIDRSPETVVEAKPSRVSLRFTSGIRSIFEDSQGRFWFGSHNEGVSRWDGHAFAYYTVADGLSGNQVRTIQEDAAGNLWFGTEHGISRFDGKSFTTQVGRNQDEGNAALGHTWRQDAGDLWFIGDSGKPAAQFDGQGVYRFDGRRLEFLPFPVSAEVATRGDYRVTAISRGRNGMIWFGTYPAVFGYDGRNFTILDGRTLGLAAEEEPFHVRSVFEDSRGVLWIGNNGLGVLRYDGRSLSNFTQQQGLDLKHKGASESLSRVFSIAEDAAGHLWFGTRDSGVWRYDGERLTHFTPRDGLTGSMVWTIYRDRRDRLWFGLGDGSVFRFNGTSFDKVY